MGTTTVRRVCRSSCKRSGCITVKTIAVTQQAVPLEESPVEEETIIAEPIVYPADCEAYRHLVAQYDWNVDTMMYAMQKESTCNPYAVGDDYVIGGIYAPSCGLLQIRTIEPSRGTCEQLKDPATNIATAYQIWTGQGYRAWSVLH